MLSENVLTGVRPHFSCSTFVIWSVMRRVGVPGSALIRSSTTSAGRAFRSRLRRRSNRVPSSSGLIQMKREDRQAVTAQRELDVALEIIQGGDIVLSYAVQLMQQSRILVLLSYLTSSSFPSHVCINTSPLLYWAVFQSSISASAR